MRRPALKTSHRNPFARPPKKPTRMKGDAERVPPPKRRK